MTISAGTARYGHYVSDGTTTVYPYPYQIFSAAELEVYVGGVLVTNYTVSGVGNLAGGNFTFQGAPAAGSNIFHKGATARTQQTDYDSYTSMPFTAAGHERALDKTVMIQLEQDEVFSRVPQLPKHALASQRGQLLPLGAVSRLLGYDSLGAFTTYPQVTAVTTTQLDHLGNYSNAMQTAVSSIGASGRMVYVLVPTTLTTNTTIPATMHMVIPPSGLITINAGVVLTFTEPPQAGRYQIFTGDGAVSFPDGATVCAEWWGAKGDNSTDSAPAITKALAANAIRMHVTLGEGIFRLGSAVEFPAVSQIIDIGLEGAGQRATILKRADGYAGILLQLGDTEGTITPTRVYNVKGLTLHGIDKAEGTIGLRCYRAGEGEFSDLFITQCEIGAWFSGGSHNIIRRTRIETNDTGLIIDNNDALSPTLYVVEDCWIRYNALQCHVNGAAHVERLHRNTVFRHTAFENHPLELGTDIGLKITKAQQVHVDQCWFEGNSQHCVIEGIADPEDEDENQNQMTAFCTWHGCNFGKQNETALALPEVPPLFIFGGNGISDGLGCSIDSCRIGEGEFQFNCTNRVELRNNGRLSDARFTGNSWYVAGGIDTESNSYEELPSKVNWRIERIHRDDGTNIYKRLDIISCETTDDADETVLAQVGIPEGATALVIATAMAKSADDLIVYARQVAGLYQCLPEAGADDGEVNRVGAVTTLIAETVTTGSEAMAFSLETANLSNSVMAKGTGLAATVMHWQVNWQIWQISGT